jgi:hypothetical protein
MKRLAILILAVTVGCKEQTKNLATKSISVGENKCIVQQMPASFQEGNDNVKTKFDYFRVILESKAKLSDSSHLNYINFGIENAFKRVMDKDTIPAVFAQRIANGKKDSYEYIVAFRKEKENKSFEILVDDQVLEIGQIALKF